MKIFLAIMRHGYGDKNRLLSYEYFNFYKTLEAMGHEVEIFDYMEELSILGKSKMNIKMLNRVSNWRPDLAFFSLYTDQFEPNIINKLREYTKTFCFFHDDTWRIKYTQFWAKYFDFFSTPDLHGETKYSKIGLKNFIHFPFGVNNLIYRKLNLTKRYDVSFVGGWHPWRQWAIDRIKKAGISVEVAGHQWPRGEISQENMIKLFNESRINLNLSNSASFNIPYLISSPSAIFNFLISKKRIEQIKARIFEINGCGSFQLSYFIKELSYCYEMDRELVVYKDIDELIEKINFYLKYDKLRESIAESGYERTLKEHTYEQRFLNIFKIIGV